MRHLAARYRAWALRQGASAQCNPWAVFLAICLLLAGPAYLYLHHHWAGFMTGLHATEAALITCGAAWILRAVARHVAAAGREAQTGQGTNCYSEDGWNATASPADAAAMAAEIDALADDAVTLMMSERGTLFALDESEHPDGKEAGL
jgi:hypothetical protein